MDPLGQFLDRLESGLTEIVQSSPFQTPVEGATHTSAKQSEVDAIPIICHGVLDRRESGVYGRDKEKRTLIIVRRVLTAPKAARAGKIPHTSFARFKVWMVRSNVERMPSRRFGRCEVEAAAELMVVAKNLCRAR